MSFKRLDIKQYMGVSFDKGMSIQELQQSLSIGLTNLKTINPALGGKLSPITDTLSTLSDTYGQIQETGATIVDLQDKIKDGEKILEQAMIAYDQGTKSALDVIGNNGSTPTFPGVTIATTPLESAITTAKTSLDQFNEQLEEQMAALSGLSSQFQVGMNTAVEKIQKQIIDQEGIEFDPEKENFIYQ